jgi:hypothetical protein
LNTSSSLGVVGEVRQEALAAALVVIAAMCLAKTAVETLLRNRLWLCRPQQITPSQWGAVEREEPLMAMAQKAKILYFPQSQVRAAEPGLAAAPAALAPLAATVAQAVAAAVIQLEA